MLVVTCECVRECDVEWVDVSAACESLVDVCVVRAWHRERTAATENKLSCGACRYLWVLWVGVRHTCVHTCGGGERVAHDACADCRAFKWLVGASQSRAFCEPTAQAH